MKIVTMIIDGAWLTDLVRTRFHEERGTVDNARELLRATGVPDEMLDDVTQRVLEGKARLRTLPDGRMAVEDDDADLPSMMQVAERTRRELDLERLKAKMESDPLAFCDPWSMRLWCGHLKNMLVRRGDPSLDEHTALDEEELAAMPPTEYLRLLLTERHVYDDETLGGTWTLEEPELMLECGFLSASSQGAKKRA